MVVPPHPHTGLQTVTWLLSGEVLHQDSIGSEQVVRPGALGLRLTDTSSASGRSVDLIGPFTPLAGSTRP